jgi:hypothetical protein
MEAEMTTPEEIKPVVSPEEHEKRALNKRLENAAWGLFLIMLGCIWLVPEEQIPQDAWLLGAGVILLGLNGIRFLKGIRPSGFTIFLGALGVLLGIGGLLGVDIPVVPILIILLGLSLVVGPLMKKR